MLSIILLAGCPRNRLKEGLSVKIKSDGVYFVFDRYDIMSIMLFKSNGDVLLSIYFEPSEINESNSMVNIGINDITYEYIRDIDYGKNYPYQIDTSGKSWHGYIKFDHKDTSMAGKTVDFEDTSKMKVTLIIDDFGKVAKKMVVKGSAYDE